MSCLLETRTELLGERKRGERKDLGMTIYHLIIIVLIFINLVQLI